MSKDKREGWLRDLKPGDLVAIPERSFGCRKGEHILCKVKRVTPTGKIVVFHEGREDLEYTHDHLGIYRAGSGAWDAPRRLVEATEGLLTVHRRARLERRFLRFFPRGMLDEEKIEALPRVDLESLIKTLEALEK